MLQVLHYFDGYATSVKSEQFWVQTESIYDEANDEDEQGLMQRNHRFMLDHLNALKNEDYIVVFAEKDRAINAVTSEIVEQMNILGLEQNITTAGSFI